MRYIIAIALLCTACIPDPRYPLPQEVQGRRIKYVLDDDLRGEAAAEWHGGPIIYYSPQFDDLSPAMQAYVLQHEYCHLLLGRDATELEADCCAIKRMYDSGHLPAEWMAEIAETVMQWPEDPTHPLGAERASTMMQCALDAPKE